MALKISKYFFSLCFLVFLFLAALSSTDSFNFEKFDIFSDKVNSEIMILLDAASDVDGSYIKMTQPWNLIVGIVRYQQPIRLTKKGSFGIHFSFSMSPERNEYGIMFMMSLEGYLSKYFMRDFVAVQLEAIYDQEFGNVNHVGIYVNRTASVNWVAHNVVKLELNSGKRMHGWVDYEASLKQVEVRVAKWGEKRPVHPSLYCPIDLSEMFNTKNVYLAFTSTSGYSNQICKLYSWSFE